MSSPPETARARVERSRTAAEALLLEDVRALRIEADLVSPGVPPPYVTRPTVEGSFALADASVGIDLRYGFETQAEDGTTVWRVGFVLHLEFRLEDGATMPTRDAVQAYAGTAAPFMAHPYARSLLHDLTARLGVQPFVLPVLRIGDGSPADEEHVGATSP